MARASIEVHHYHHFASDTDTAQTLARIEQKLAQVLTQGAEMATDLSALDAAVARAEAAVAADTALDSSAVTLLDELAQLLRDNAADPAAVQALADRLDSANTSGDSSNAALVDALTRNTPAGPPVEEVPPA